MDPQSLDMAIGAAYPLKCAQPVLFVITVAVKILSLVGGARLEIVQKIKFHVVDPRDGDLVLHSISIGVGIGVIGWRSFQAIQCSVQDHA